MITNDLSNPIATLPRLLGLGYLSVALDSIWLVDDYDSIESIRSILDRIARVLIIIRALMMLTRFLVHNRRIHRYLSACVTAQCPNASG